MSDEPKRRLKIEATEAQTGDIMLAVSLRAARADITEPSDPGALLASICRTWRESENRLVREAHEIKAGVKP